jgi:hypothetical protein
MDNISICYEVRKCLSSLVLTFIDEDVKKYRSYVRGTQLSSNVLLHLASM